MRSVGERRNLKVAATRRLELRRSLKLQGDPMSSGAKILVIDDEKAIRKFLEVSLESSGYRVYLTKVRT